MLSLILNLEEMGIGINGHNVVERELERELNPKCIPHRNSQQGFDALFAKLDKNFIGVELQSLHRSNAALLHNDRSTLKLLPYK